MARLIAIFFLLLLASGCSDSNNGAPNVNEAHPDDWVFTHPEEAREDPDGCRSCHGLNFEGNREAVSCFACHPFGLAPQVTGSFTVHPPSWGSNIFLNHQTFPLQFNWTTCANGACHGTNLRGGIAGPSCFLAGCHLGNPPTPHPVPPDQPFALPEFHGVVALDGLFSCFNCHGRPPATFDGGFVSDPAILGKPSGNCSLCHPVAQAHPTNWQGTNDLPDDTATRDARSPTHTSSHRNVDVAAISNGCALCHNVSAPGAGPAPAAPSCFTAGFTNAEGSATGCHLGGPGSLAHPLGQPWLDKKSATFHGNSALDCTPCHGADLQGGTSGVSCFTCHFAPSGSRVPPSSGWIHGFAGHQAYQAFQGVCNTCHGTNRTFGNAPGACHDCHGEGP